jgi:hypothetical protein
VFALAYGMFGGVATAASATGSTHLTGIATPDRHCC